jgi:hypothetical protein
MAMLNNQRVIAGFLHVSAGYSPQSKQWVIFAVQFHMLLQVLPRISLGAGKLLILQETSVDFVQKRGLG